MPYIPKENVTQSLKSNKGIFSPNEVIKLDKQLNIAKKVGIGTAGAIAGAKAAPTTKGNI